MEPKYPFLAQLRDSFNKLTTLGGAPKVIRLGPVEHETFLREMDEWLENAPPELQYVPASGFGTRFKGAVVERVEDAGVWIMPA